MDWELLRDTKRRNRAIWYLYQEGFTYRELMKIFGFKSTNSITKILRKQAELLKVQLKRYEKKT